MYSNIAEEAEKTAVTGNFELGKALVLKFSNWYQMMKKPTG